MSTFLESAKLKMTEWNDYVMDSACHILSCFSLAVNRLPISCTTNYHYILHLVLCFYCCFLLLRPNKQYAYFSIYLSAHFICILYYNLLFFYFFSLFTWILSTLMASISLLWRLVTLSVLLIVCEVFFQTSLLCLN